MSSIENLNLRYVGIRKLFTDKDYPDAKRAAMALLAEVQAIQPPLKGLERCLFNVLGDIARALSRQSLHAHSS
jgi:hypothetical protein